MSSPGTPVSGVLTDPGRTSPSTAGADRRAPGVTGPGGSSRPRNGRRRRQQSTLRLDVQCPPLARRPRWEKDQPVTGKSINPGGRRELLQIWWGDFRPGAPPKPSLQMGPPPFGNKSAAMNRCRNALWVVPPQCSQLRTNGAQTEKANPQSPLRGLKRVAFGAPGGLGPQLSQSTSPVRRAIPL